MKIRMWLYMALEIALLAALLVGAVATRRWVLDAQRQLTADGRIPFSLESALAFRRIQLVYRDGALPERDRAVEWPAGIRTRETDTVGAEVWLARAAKMWPGTLRLEEKVRWLEVLWFALALPGMFYWVKGMGGGRMGGFVAGAFYAVAISAVARSTGQEFSHENHAIPFLVWSWAAAVWGARRMQAAGAEGGGLCKGGVALGWVSALLTAGALCAWDLVQYYLGLVWVWMLWRALGGRLTKAELWGWAVPLMACVLAASVRNPYLRAHGFWMSPVMGLGWGVLLAGSPSAQRSRVWLRVVLGLFPLAVALVAGRVWGGGAYGHFASLLWAKLRFMNVRPSDPGLLTFDQRILWVPALHSATWALVKEWFPALLWLTAVSGLALMACNRLDRRSYTAFPFLNFCLWVSFCAFLLFFRFHVWLSLYACAVTGWCAGQVLGAAVRKGERVVFTVVAAVLLAGWGVEAHQTWVGPLDGPAGNQTRTGPVRWGRPNVYAQETEELMDHLRTYVAPEPVLANFGISASIAAYGGCPVVLHPKFESVGIRQKVEEYAEALFKGSEAEFGDWMAAQGATVYVHSMGEFSAIQPELQMRYMAGVPEPATNVAARLFEQRPEELTQFAPQFANRKFRVFRLKRSVAGGAMAATLAEQSVAALAEGRLAEAERLGAHALRLDAENVAAQEALRHATALRDAGFSVGGAEEEWVDAEDALAPALAPADPPWTTAGVE